MMSTCASCKFFGSEMSLNGFDYETDVELETGHHACARIIHGNSGDDPMSKVAKELAVVTDGSGYAARLRVLSSFGCVLHEAKEPR